MPMNAAKKQSEPIKVRDRRFPLDDVPRDWHPAGRAVARFFDGLSIFFPVGERFFIKSVKAFRAAVPRGTPLADEVRAFCAQEAFHGREHEAYNARLERLGYPAFAMEGRVSRLLGRVTRLTPRRFQLAATCALEHYTAFMGHVVLGEPRLLAGADPAMAALWRWHSVEENEHKAVAFDVYGAAGGRWPERALAMAAATLVFWAKVAEHQVRLMRVDGDATSLRAWGELLRFLFISPGGMAAVVPAVLDYLRPGFHPHDRDTSALIAAWRCEADVAPEAA